MQIATMQIQLSILTLNIWGIPYISKDRNVRIPAIGEKLASSDYDIVSLQEVWSIADFECLRDKVRGVLPYSHYFYSGVYGSGLCIFSKYKIIGTLFHSWPINGYIHRIQHGDWFGGKGVGLCKLAVNGATVHVYLAHLHAEYDRVNDEYKAHRIIQAFDTAQFIESTRGESVLQVLAGDLNTEPGDLAHQILIETARLRDTCDSQFAQTLTGTNECPKNTYTSPTVKIQLPEGKRIDYILYRGGIGAEVSVVNHSLPFEEHIPGHMLSYSDHEAVNAIIKISKTMAPEGAEIKFQENAALSAIVLGSDVCKESLVLLHNHKVYYLTVAMVGLILLFTIMDLVAPYGLRWLFIVFRVLLSGCIIFNVLMGTLWNSMETNAILSGKLAMDVAVEGIKQFSDKQKL